MTSALTVSFVLFVSELLLRKASDECWIDVALCLLYVQNRKLLKKYVNSEFTACFCCLHGNPHPPTPKKKTVKKLFEANKTKKLKMEININIIWKLNLLKDSVLCLFLRT